MKRTLTPWKMWWQERATCVDKFKDWQNFRRDPKLMKGIQTKHGQLDYTIQLAKQFGVPSEMWEDSKFGNPEGRVVDGVFVTANSVRHAMYCWRISKYFDVIHSTHPVDILEIGGGFGGMARMLSRFYRVRTYTFVDGRPLLEIQRNYMGMVDPEIDCIRFIEHDAIHEHEDLRFDLFLNSNSLAEMPPEEVGRYFDYIQGTLKAGGIFYSWNRKYRDTHFHEYPFDEQWKFLEVNNIDKQSKDKKHAWVECIARRELTKEASSP